MVKLSICKYDNKQCDVKEQYWHWIRDGIQPPLFLDPPTLIQQESCHLTQWSREINVISPPAHPKKYHKSKKIFGQKSLECDLPSMSRYPAVSFMSCLIIEFKIFLIKVRLNGEIAHWASILFILILPFLCLNPTHSLATNHLAQIFAVLVLFNKSWFKEMSRRVERKIISKKYTKFIFAINWNYKNIYSWIEVF